MATFNPAAPMTFIGFIGASGHPQVFVTGSCSPIFILILRIRSGEARVEVLRNDTTFGKFVLLQVRNVGFFEGFVLI